MVRSISLHHQTILLHLLHARPANLNGKTQSTQYDIKNHKIFLKKILYPEVKLSDLYIGNVVVCFNRQLKIVAFGDEFTKKELVGEDSSNKYTLIYEELTGC
jgi:hypothetical protein